MKMLSSSSESPRVTPPCYSHLKPKSGEESLLQVMCQAKLGSWGSQGWPSTAIGERCVGPKFLYIQTHLLA